MGMNRTGRRYLCHHRVDFYFKNELMLLKQAGFDEVTIWEDQFLGLYLGVFSDGERSSHTSSLSYGV